MEGKRCSGDDESRQVPEAVVAHGASSKCKNVNNICNYNNVGNADNSNYTINQTNEKGYENDLKIMYTNADCLTNKREDLLVVLNNVNNKPDVIVITEVNSKSCGNKMLESEFNIEGYKIYSRHV